MTLNALKHGDVAEVERVSEGLVRLVARLAFAVGKASEINWVFKCSCARVSICRASRVVNHRVADVAVVPDDLSRLANVLTIMAAETA